MLTAKGIVKGDRVIIFMPMVPEAAISMLACAHVVAIHSVVFGGFAATELTTRIDDATPKLIISAYPDVAECAVIGIADKLKGRMPLGFLVLNAGANRHLQEIESEVIRLVREKIGPVAAFKQAIAVNRLPKPDQVKSCKAPRSEERRVGKEC